MRLFKTIALVVSVMLLSSCAQVDYDIFGTLTGQVVEQSTGEPLNQVSVLLSPGGKNVYTGTDGLFTFEELDPQQYTVMVQKEGYVTNRKTVTVVTSETNHVTITMQAND